MKDHNKSNYTSFYSRKLKEGHLMRGDTIDTSQVNIETKERLLGAREIDSDFDKEFANSLNNKIIEEGEILAIEKATLVESEFSVELLYQGRKTTAFASKTQLINKNIGALLDYY